MFNLLLALITGLVIGWNFHSFFMQLNPPNILISDINITQPPIIQAQEKEITPVIIPHKLTIQEIQKNIQVLKEKRPKVLTNEENTSIPKIKKIDNFYELLHNDLFSDAMSLYLDASEIKVSLYQSTLIQYFKDKINENPQKASEQMLEFQELEPSHTKINMETLDEIAENDYVEKAKILLKLIKEKINKTEEYNHQLPLKKVGEHFTITVKINNEPLTLLLDTGATLTIVNEEKLSSLTVLKEHIVLNTVGGEIYAQLQEADTFSIGDIKLEKFQIVSSSFEQKEADGLLGMNFFKAFKFKIDQEKAFLYLSEIKK